MRRISLAGALLIALASVSCGDKSSDNPAKTGHRPLKEFLIGTWDTHELKGKGRPDFVVKYSIDGMTTTLFPDGRSGMEPYKVVDEQSLEYLGPPQVRSKVQVISEDEWQEEYLTAGTALQHKRKK